MKFLLFLIMAAFVLALDDEFKPLSLPNGYLPPRIYHKVGPYAFYTYPIDYDVYSSLNYGCVM